ncbi:MAG: hypothetical protein WC399_00990 [Bacilli bacterium]|jgi:hypothetical protein
MNDVKTLVMMQLTDKLDFGFLRERANLIRRIVFFVLRFIIVTLVALGLFFLASFLKIFHNSPYLPTSVMTMILSIMLVISTFTCTNGLVQSLYLAQDNQILVTFPVSANRIFLSKIIIFYIYEIYKNVTFTLPIFIAYGIMSPVSWVFYLWVFVAFLFVSLIPVVLGVVLSLPVLLINRLFARAPFFKNLFSTLLVAAFVYLIVRLILIIPDEINVINYWGPIKNMLTNLTTFFQTWFLPVYYVVVMVIGKYDASMHYTYWHQEPVLVFLSLIAVLAALFFMTYFLSRFYFIKMTSRSFEYEKNIRIQKPKNRPWPPFVSFIVKEIRLAARSGAFAYNFMATYISIPLIVLLLNQIFDSMDLYPNGEFIVQAFNVFIILLPLLASNSILATVYSREGRVGYMKRTKPIKIVFPLLAKILPNIVLSLISLGVSVYIFDAHMHYELTNILFLGLGLGFIQVGHILFSALLDIMNPQNEQYATTGDQINNPNETKATVIAFIVSFLVAMVTFGFMIEEQVMPEASYNPAFAKVLIIGALFFGTGVYMFVNKVKAYYYDPVR